MTEPIRINPTTNVPFEDIYIHFTLPEEYINVPMDYTFVLQGLTWEFHDFEGVEILVVITEDLARQLCLGTYQGLLQVCDEEEYRTVVIQEFIISEEVETSYITTIPIIIPSKEDKIATHNMDPTSHPYILSQIERIDNEIYNYGDIVTYNAENFYSSTNPDRYINIDFIKPFEPLILDKISGNLYVDNSYRIPTVEEVQKIYSNETNISELQVNKQDKSNLVTSVSSESTDQQYPSAKLLYDLLGDLESVINSL